MQGCCRSVLLNPEVPGGSGGTVEVPSSRGATLCGVGDREPQKVAEQTSQLRAAEQSCAGETRWLLRLPGRLRPVL